MAAPIKPNRTSVGPITVADIQVEYPEDFRPGEPYVVHIILSRSLNPYEERAAREELRLDGFRAELDELTTHREVEDIDPHMVLDFLEALEKRGAERRAEADEERQRIREHAKRIRSVLRPE